MLFDTQVAYKIKPFSAKTHVPAFQFATQVANFIKAMPVPKTLQHYEANVTICQALVTRIKGGTEALDAVAVVVVVAPARWNASICQVGPPVAGAVTARLSQTPTEKLVGVQGVGGGSLSGRKLN